MLSRSSGLNGPRKGWPGLPNTRRRSTPLSPFFPWQTSHRFAKIAAPSLAVPRPSGSCCPCGPIMKSKLLISSWLRGVPTLCLGDCASPAAGAARIISGTSRLREHRIVHAPIAGHPPGLDGIEMNGADGFFRFLVSDAPVLIQLRARRLNVTSFIRATRHEHRLFSVPSPVKRKPGMRLRVHGRLKLGFLPTLAAVGGHFDLADRAPTGPRQAGNLDISPAG